MNDFMNISILNTRIDIRNLTKIEFSSEFSFGSNLTFEFEKEIGFLLDIEVDKDFHYTDLSPKLKTFDEYMFRLSTFKISYTYEQEQSAITIAGYIPFKNPIMTRVKDLFLIQNDVGLAFAIDVRNLDSIELDIILNEKTDFGKFSLLDSCLVMDYKNEQFSIGVKTTLDIQIDRDDEQFKGVMALSYTEFSLEAQLLSKWEAPFGIKQCTVKQAFIKLGITEIPPYFLFDLSGDA